MTPISNYKRFITELVRKHMLILGPNIARDIALSIRGLKIDTTGDVLDIAGTPPMVLDSLINSYIELSQPVTQLVLYQLLHEYPEIRAEYNQPFEKIKLVCSLTSSEKR